MAQVVIAGAMLQCSFGVAPSSLVVLPLGRPMAPMPVATIMDNKPIANILPFGMCSAPSNPTVIAATAAALGVFTPAPCVPNTVAPWIPGATKVLVGGIPALTNACTLMCMWGGAISITNAGQMKVTGT
ncbi:MAG: DUF4280 domain-containing protein [Deltaproteobacteria bacterium]|nr:DUF4280 domain-containing protein [Deltaproteobacteria bacterium]